MAIILAAGKGTRMKSTTHKVLHPVCGKPMIGHILDQLEEVNVQRLVTVVGHEADKVKEYVGERSEFVVQEQLLGTGHAVKQVEPLLGQQTGLTIVVNSDMPLLTAASIQSMLHHHVCCHAAATVLTAIVDDPTGYGRIVRDHNGNVEKIVEQKDCTPSETEIKEINTGIFCFDNEKLFAALKELKNNNKQNEYYLTDVMEIMRNRGESIQAFTLQNKNEAQGVNDRVQLAEVERLMRKGIITKHMVNGVTIIDPSSVYIDQDVVIGQDTLLYPNTYLYGASVIGEGCTIGPNTEIKDSVIGKHVEIKQSTIAGANIGNDTVVGPFAYIRPGTELASKAQVGRFVEVKNTYIGEGSKLPHLSYVGDAQIGKGVNIGCGVITANYDGVNKHRTTIEDEAFIGSNSNLIAPIHIGKGAYVVAGSTCTKDVKEEEMAIARARQTNKEGYAKKYKKRASVKKEK